MNDEIKEILRLLKSSSWCNEAEQIEDCITNLQEEVEDLRRIFGVWNNRKLIKKFNKEYDKEDKNKNPNRDYVVIYPDAEEVYKRYYVLKEENERLKAQVELLEDNRKYLNNKIGKGIKYIHKCRDYHRTYHNEDKMFPDELTSLEMVLRGDDKE